MRTREQWRHQAREWAHLAINGIKDGASISKVREWAANAAHSAKVYLYARRTGIV
jgi:hypothetical protein